MQTRLLLAALMERAGDNPNSLATKVRGKTKQPQIFKFLAGVSKEPRRSTLEPLADHYGIPVDAFYDKELAARLLDNLRAGRSVLGDDPESPWPFPGIDRSRFDKLTHDQKMEIQGVVRSQIEAFERPNGHKKAA